MTFAGIDFSASISAQAGQFSYERAERVVDLLADARALEVGARLVDLGELGLRLVDRLLHGLREPDGGDDHLHVLEVRAAEVAREVRVERLRDRLLDLDEIGVRLIARGLVERAGGRAQQRARGDEVLALELPDRLAQRVVEHGAELGVEERAEALVAIPRVQPVAAAGDGIGAVAEAGVELLHQLVVALAGEGGGERDLRLEPDVDAVGGRHAQHVDADAIAAPGRARDDVAPRRALRRVQPRVLREPAGPGQAGGRRDQLPLRLLVQRAAVVDHADFVRAGARKAAERHEREDDHQQPEPDRTDRKTDPSLTAGLARSAPAARQLRQLVLEGHTRNVQTAGGGPTRMVASRPARVAQLVEREPSKLEVAGSRPVARFGAERDRVDCGFHGEWRSLVAHPAGGRAVAGSNPVSPTEAPANIA